MGKRETIIVIIAVIALLYGLYEKVFTTHSRVQKHDVGESAPAVKSTEKDIEARLLEINRIGAGDKDNIYNTEDREQMGI
ncbi:MAG: hypothetical protein HQL01_09935 [Nitrospirae bacterium]|nr:hypothetical protein [Nitrospirota bacterium]